MAGLTYNEIRISFRSGDSRAVKKSETLKRRFVMEFKKILNPVDGSSHSINSTRYAIDLAKKFDSKILLLHCHARFPVVLSEPYFQQAIDEIMKSSEDLVKPY
jgi:hypothetical protein